MKIKILGPGCARCQQLEKTAREVVKKLGIEATIEEVKDIKKITEYPILTTPGLVINEKLVSAGRIPSAEEVISWVEEALANQEKEKSSE